MNILLKWMQQAACLPAGRDALSAARELAAQAERFEGLYEPAFRFAGKASERPSPLREWTVRAQRISPDGPLARYLERLGRRPRRQGRRLMRLIRAAGIRRERYDGSTLTATDGQARAYLALDGHEILPGERISVLKAAWYLNERVVEHGLAGELS